MNFAERFWIKVEKTETCWIWTGYTMRQGYGQVRGPDGKVWLAHRAAYKLTNGELPPFDLDHLATCPKSCVNPEHIRPATRKQNMENVIEPNRNSKSGVRGVVKVNNRWRVYVMHHRKLHHGGYYTTKEEATEAVKALRNKLFTFNDADREPAA